MPRFSSKISLYVAGLTGVGSGAARSLVWLYHSWEMSGSQIWAPALVSFALVATMIALIYRVFIEAADEADPLNGWLESREMKPPEQ
jgi:hypothetical protein